MDEKTINKLKYSIFLTAYDSFESFYITDSAIKLFKKGRNVSITPIQKRIIKQNLPFYLDKNILRNILCENPKFNAKYLISFLTSIELELLYEEDPEYSFYIFEQIRNNKTDSVYQNLKQNKINFIEIESNLNYKSLQKTIQKMNNLIK